MNDSPPYAGRDLACISYGRQLELLVAVPTPLHDDASTIARPIPGQTDHRPADLVKRIRRSRACRCPVNGLSRRRGVHPDAAVATTRSPPTAARYPARIRRPIRCAEGAAESPNCCPTNWTASPSRRRRAGDPRRRHGARQDHSGDRRRRAARARSRDPKVLVVCPASVKSQWRSEIERFSERNSSDRPRHDAAERAAQYDEMMRFFTICNYEQVLRDILRDRACELGPDRSRRGPAHQELGGQDDADTSRVCARHSRWCLSGTPLENRLDDLFSVVRVHRRPPARSGFSVLQPPSSHRRGR